MKKRKTSPATLPELEGFNPPQREAIISESAKTLVVAGPGSGKTATIVARISYLVHVLGVKPANIVCITFTNAAAGEMERRLRATKLFGPAFKIGYCGTLHGFLFRMIQKQPELVGYCKGVGIIDETQADTMLKNVIVEQRYSGTIANVREALKTGPIQLVLGKEYLSKPQLVASAYFSKLRDSNLVDFDLILNLGYKLLSHLKQKGAKESGWNYTDLCVDEYQDSSAIDALIYEAMPCDRGFFVGDSDQAIYSFRGGDVKNIMGLADRKDAKIIRLELNYRSGSIICHRAQTLIEHNNRIAKKTISASGKYSNVNFYLHENASDEVKYIAQTIRIKFPEGKYDCAVLVRSNYLVQEISKHIESYGLPVSRKKFEAKPADWDRLIHVLGLMINPDNHALAQMFILKYYADGKQKVAQAAKSLSSLNESVLHIPYDLAMAGAVEGVSRMNFDPDTLALVASAAATLPEDSSVTDLLFSLTSNSEHQEETGTGVVVTTLHASKGREWEVVFMPALELSILPLTSKDTDIEEERRLAYVGMTRAKTSLYLSRSQTRRTQWGGFQALAMEPSPFIEETGILAD